MYNLERDTRSIYEFANCVQREREREKGRKKLSSVKSRLHQRTRNESKSVVLARSKPYPRSLKAVRSVRRCSIDARYQPARVTRSGRQRRACRLVGGARGAGRDWRPLDCANSVGDARNLLRAPFPLFSSSCPRQLRQAWSSSSTFE